MTASDTDKNAKNPSSSLTCIQTLKPPTNTSTKSAISKTDQLLSAYASKHETASSSPVWKCSWSNDGTILATCHGRPDPCVRLWKYFEDDQKWTLTATLRDGQENESSLPSSSLSRTIRSMEFAPTPLNLRKILAVASFDGSISIWEEFSTQNSTNAGPQHKLDVHTPCGWECTAQLEGHENEVKDVTWNATGTLLASCGRDKSVWIWECFLPGTIGGYGTGNSAATGGVEGDFECLAVLQAHTGDVKSIKFAPSHGQFGDGDEILLSASYDDTIKCWAEDAGEWYCALTLQGVHSSTIWTLAISPGGVRMVSGSADKSLAIWRCYTASEKKQMELNKNDDSGVMHSDGLWKCVGKLADAHDHPIYSVDCAPSKAGHGRIVSAGADNCINIYREVGGSSDSPLFTKDARKEMAHDGDVNCVIWHPTNGRMLASAGDDGYIKIWKYNM